VTNFQLPAHRRGAEPFFYRGNGKVGCLCLHGFTASPDEVRWLGECLSGAGVTTYGPRLFAHGYRNQDMLRVRWEDWYMSALDAYHVLKNQCEQIFVAGLSMGGLLSLMLASQVETAGVIAMAAPLYTYPTNPPLELAPFLKWVRRWNVVGENQALIDRLAAEQPRRGFPAVGRVRYDLWSTHAIGEFYKTSLLAFDALPHITAPMLLVYAPKDDAVPIGNIEWIKRHAVNAVQIDTVILRESGHIVTQDVECDEVFDAAIKFVQQNA
jgi:carboxylesterase